MEVLHRHQSLGHNLFPIIEFGLLLEGLSRKVLRWGAMRDGSRTTGRRGCPAVSQWPGCNFLDDRPFVCCFNGMSLYGSGLFPVSPLQLAAFGLQFDYRSQRLQSRTNLANRSVLKLVYTNKEESGIIRRIEILGRNDESTYIQAVPGTRFGRIDGSLEFLTRSRVVTNKDEM